MYNNKEINNINKYSDIILGVICLFTGVILAIFVNNLGRPDLFPAILIGVGIAILGIFWTYKGMNTKKRIEKEEEHQFMLAQKLKNDYFESLKGLDKAEALRLGRKYYGSLREDGRVTTYDEQAITNDINSMTNTVNVVNRVIHKVEKEEPKLNNSASNQKTLYCSKCGKAYLPNMNKLFCEECGNRY
jgi:hypothetical protein